MTSFVVAGFVLTVALAAASSGGGSSEPARLYVALDGDDSWSGELASPNAEGTDGPFASLTRARDEIRVRESSSGFEVVVRGGIYDLDEPFVLVAEDSGTATAPVRYLAAPGEVARLSGGRRVTGFAPVSDPEDLARLDESARAHVLRANLADQGLGDFGSPAGGGIELFFGDEPMTLARWPNEGFVHVVDVVVKDGHVIHGREGSKTGAFLYAGDRPRRWLDEPDVWLHGYWFWDWSDERQRIERIDVEGSRIDLASPYHRYGYRKGQWYYAYNALAELDAPGEWYLDREEGELWFWPPAPVEDGSVVVSVLPTLVTMTDVSHVTLRGFTLEAARGTALTVSGGAHVRLEGCTIRNVGGDAIRVTGGKDHGVIGCDMYAMGGGGASLSGGDRATLEPAGHFAENNHVHHYGRWNRMYEKAVSLGGVGNRASHNLIHDAPHIAIGFGGNDHVLEYNEIHDVCLESNDAGAIYAGRDWTMRGHVIRYNYLHDITGFEGRGCVGVYLDDMFSSADIVGNVFHRVTRAAFLGGGRDCSIVNNVFVDCEPALHVDGRALGWAHYHADEWIAEASEKGTLKGIAYDRPPYSERYPELPGILADEPKAPKGNVIAHNVCWGGRWEEIYAEARPFVIPAGNLVGVDPLFVDPEGHDFRLREDSPAFGIGFEPIPFERIGLYEDERRASWPTSHGKRSDSSGESGER